eukprot:GHVT01047544.1.p1 GENE.GHVT01047544.1~~GHVT01047544.1.p1  ORF type:complete len:173 (-),score=38.05 GHVT01047544.1:378-896(-)
MATATMLADLSKTATAIFLMAWRSWTSKECIHCVCSTLLTASMSAWASIRAAQCFDSSELASLSQSGTHGAQGNTAPPRRQSNAVRAQTPSIIRAAEGQEVDEYKKKASGDEEQEKQKRKVGRKRGVGVQGPEKLIEAAAKAFKSCVAAVVCGGSRPARLSPPRRRIEGFRV